MRTSTNCLIMNLAVCDLLTIVLLTPLFIKELYVGDTWIGGKAGSLTCKIFPAFGISVLLSCSVFNFIAIAIDRFFAVSRPLTYKLSSRWVVKIGIPATWFVSALFSIKATMSSDIGLYDEDYMPKCMHFERASDKGYLSLCVLLLSLVILIVLYSIISYRLWRRNIPGEVSYNQQALAIRTARKVTVLMISVVLVFVVSWAPAFANMVLVLMGSSSLYTEAMRYPFLFAFSYWLVSNNTACNPCLYFIFIESFRQSMTSACSRCRAPKLRLCRIGQERRIETQEPMRDRQMLNVYTQEERAIELIAYSTVNHGVTPTVDWKKAK